MKFTTYITVSIILLLSVNMIEARSKAKSKSRAKAKQFITPILSRSSLPFYGTLARLSYCPTRVIQDLSCRFCDRFGSYSPFKVFSANDNEGLRHQFTVLVNDSKREIVLSFSGPGSESGSFFTNLYTRGFIKVPELRNSGIEEGYWNIYSTLIRNSLVKTIGKLKLSKPGYNFVFTGHSFGGSIALVSAFDLVNQKLISGTPKVFTYGQLRIGDLKFVGLVNNVLQVIKVVKNDDYLTRIPNCYFLNGSYRCSSNIESLEERLPGIQDYFAQYVTPQSVATFVGSSCFGPLVEEVRDNIPVAPIPRIYYVDERKVEAETIQEIKTGVPIVAPVVTTPRSAEVVAIKNEIEEKNREISDVEDQISTLNSSDLDLDPKPRLHASVRRRGLEEENNIDDQVNATAEGEHLEEEHVEEDHAEEESKAFFKNSCFQ